MFRKILLRKRLLKYAQPGAAFVPFIGDGDIACELYQDRKVYGADIDPERVATARGRCVDATIIEADCNSWPFHGVAARFAVADLDAYANPYPALVSFWQSAAKASRLVIFGTDGLRQRIKRGGVLKELPSGRETKAPLVARRNAFNFWFPKHVKPFIESVIEPARIIQQAFYLRKDMLYWGIVVEQ